VAACGDRDDLAVRVGRRRGGMPARWRAALTRASLNGPAGWYAAGFLLQTVGLLSIRSRHLALHGAVPESEWDKALASSVAGQQRMAEIIAAALAEFGQDAQPVVDLYRKNAQRILRGEAPTDQP